MYHPKTAQPEWCTLIQTLVATMAYPPHEPHMRLTRANPLAPRTRGKQFPSCSRTIKRVGKLFGTATLIRQTTRRGRLPSQLGEDDYRRFFAALSICRSAAKQNNMGSHAIPDAVFRVNSGASFFPDL